MPETISLTPQPIAMDEVVAEVEGRSRTLEAVGFFDRQRSSSGRFMDREQIEKRSGARDAVWVDNVLMQSGRPTNWEAALSAHDIEGVEVYSRPAQVPVRFGGSQLGCGAIVIWTRRGDG